MKQYTKTEDNKLRVVETIPEKVKPAVDYDLDFLLQQREEIQKQKDEFDVLRDAELHEVDSLIAQAKNLEIKSADSATLQDNLVEEALLDK